MSLVAQSPHSSYHFDPSAPSMDAPHPSQARAQAHQAAFLAQTHPNQPQQIQQQQQMMNGQQQQQSGRPLVRRTASQQHLVGGQPGGYGGHPQPMMRQGGGPPPSQGHPQQYSPQQQQHPNHQIAAAHAASQREAYHRAGGQGGQSQNIMASSSQQQAPLPPSQHPPHVLQPPLTPYQTPHTPHASQFLQHPQPPTPSQHQQHLVNGVQHHQSQSTPPPPLSAQTSQGGGLPPPLPPQAFPLGSATINGQPPPNGMQQYPQRTPSHAVLAEHQHQHPNGVPRQQQHQLQQQQQQQYAQTGGPRRVTGGPPVGLGLGPPPPPGPSGGRMMVRAGTVSGGERGINGLGLSPSVSVGTGPSGSHASPVNPKEPGHGYAILRLLQYFSGFSDGERRGELSYWRDHVKAYFSDDAIVSVDLKSSTKGDTKHFEVATPILPRYFLVGYETGLKSITVNLENPAESRMRTSSQGIQSITVDVPRASMTHTYVNGCQVVTNGSLKCILVLNPEITIDPTTGLQSDANLLFIERIQYQAYSHTEYVARAAMVPQLVSKEQRELLSGAMGGGGGGTDSRTQTPAAQAPTPTMTPKTASADSTTSRKGKGKAAAGAGEKEEGSGEGGDVNDEGGAGGESMTGASTSEGAASMPEMYSLPESSVNDFGVSPGMMRCLELAQGVSVMGPLFAFCQAERIGPKEGLRRYADHLRASSSSDRFLPLGVSSSHSSSSQSTSSPPQPPTPLATSQQQQQQQSTSAAPTSANSAPTPQTHAPTPAPAAESPKKTDSTAPASRTTITLKRKQSQSAREEGEEGNEAEQKEGQKSGSGRPVRSRTASSRRSGGGS